MCSIIAEYSYEEDIQMQIAMEIGCQAEEVESTRKMLGIGVSQKMCWYCLKVRPGNSYGHH